MTDVERELLAAIIAAPDDDGPRLVYADWLQQHGDPRGELVVLGCEIARLDARDRRRYVLENRQRALADALRATFPQAAAGRFEMIERGFPRQLALAGDQLAQLARELARMPIVNLRLVLGGKHVPALVRADLGHVRELELIASSGLGKQAMRQLADWPALAGVRELSLWRTRVTGDALAELLASPHLARLRALRLRTNQLAADAVLAVAASPRAAELEVLDVSGNRLDREAIDALARLPKLRDLAMLDQYMAPSDYAGLRHVLPRLERLALTSARLDWQIASLLATTAGALRYLHVGGTLGSPATLDADGMRVLAGAPILRDVVELHVARYGIGDAGVERLVEVGPLARLAILGLDGNKLGNAGAAALANAPAARALCKLGLSENQIQWAGGKALAASPYLGELVHLALRGNDQLGPAKDDLRARFGDRVELDGAS